MYDLLEMIEGGSGNDGKGPVVTRRSLFSLGAENAAKVLAVGLVVAGAHEAQDSRETLKAKADTINGLRLDSFIGLGDMAQAWQDTPYADALERISRDLFVENGAANRYFPDTSVSSEQIRADYKSQTGFSEIVVALANGAEEPRHVTYLRTYEKAKQVFKTQFSSENDKWQEDLARMVGYVGVRTSVLPGEGTSSPSPLRNADDAYGLLRNFVTEAVPWLKPHAEQIRNGFLEQLDPQNFR